MWMKMEQPAHQTLRTIYCIVIIIIIIIIIIIMFRKD